MLDGPGHTDDGIKGRLWGLELLRVGISDKDLRLSVVERRNL